MDDATKSALKPSETVKMKVRDLNFYYGKFQALKNINLEIPEKKVTAFIGPSGCGKSTLLRVFNRMFELYPEQRAEGEVNVDGENILKSKEDVALIRAKIGMVFQKPTPFPMSIYDNIAFGVKLFEDLSKSALDDRVEWALRKGALWNEVKDKLGQSAGSDLDVQDRRADRRAEVGLHHRDRHPQHATGRARVRLHGVHVSRRHGRIRGYGPDLYQAEEEGNRGLHNRPFRLMQPRTDRTESRHGNR